MGLWGLGNGLISAMNVFLGCLKSKNGRKGAQGVYKTYIFLLEKVPSILLIFFYKNKSCGSGDYIFLI